MERKIIKNIQNPKSSVGSLIFSSPKQRRMISYCRHKFGNIDERKEHNVLLNFPEIYFKFYYQKETLYLTYFLCAFIDDEGSICYPYLPNIDSTLYVCQGIDVSFQDSIENLIKKTENQFWNSLFSFHMANSYMKYSGLNWNTICQESKKNKDYLPNLKKVPENISTSFMES